jgi:hypothetical protein
MLAGGALGVDEIQQKPAGMQIPEATEVSEPPGQGLRGTVRHRPHGNRRAKTLYVGDGINDAPVHDGRHGRHGDRTKRRLSSRGNS